MISSKKLSKFKNIRHAFFNANGGKSKGIYKSLNCGPGSKDKPNFVKQNLEIVKKKIGKTPNNIFLLHQIHSSKIIYIHKNYKFSKQRPKADAIITNQKKLPIAVLTADCAPLLLFDDEKKIIAAIHAGWKGAYKGIINKVIKFMKKKGCMTKNITAAIGPTISFKKYEIREDFKSKFLKKNQNNKVFFKNSKGKMYFNLSKYILKELKDNKIRNIDIINKDTFNVNNNFFSARRALSLSQNDYGRNISIIMIN